MTKRTNPRKDFTQVAFDVFKRAVGEVEQPATDPAKQAAVESGRKGGKVGGAARANKLTPERRAEIAKKAAAKRWGHG